jgi:hypothetical protein
MTPIGRRVLLGEGCVPASENGMPRHLLSCPTPIPVQPRNEVGDLGSHQCDDLEASHWMRPVRFTGQLVSCQVALPGLTGIRTSYTLEMSTGKLRAGP